MKKKEILRKREIFEENMFYGKSEIHPSFVS